MLPAYIFDRKRGRKVVVEYFSNNGFPVRDTIVKVIVLQLIIFVNRNKIVGKVYRIFHI